MNLTDYPNDEPHYELYNNVTTDDTHGMVTMLEGACISCQTGVNVKVTLTCTETASTTIFINATCGPSGWIEVTIE